MNRILLSSAIFACLFSAFTTNYAKDAGYPNDLIPLVREDFEIYAPRQSDLERASEAVAHAREVYKRYFGKDAPKMALVLYDEPSQAGAFDEKKFTERGFGLLKWRASGIPFKNTYSPALEAVITESVEDNLPKVLAIYSEKTASEIKLQKGDSFLAINDRPLASLDDFLREYKNLVPESTATLKVRRDGNKIEIKFTKPKMEKFDAETMMKVQALIKEERLPIGKTVIAHEAMHKLMRTGLPDSLNIPAWYSEGLASLAEYPSDLKQRRQRMRDKMKDRIPLKELFTMVHPATGGTVISSNENKGKMMPGTPVTVQTSNPAGQIFYEQSMTLLEFLAEAEGDQFIGQLGRKLANGQSIENILRSMRKPISDLSQFEADWEKWLNRC